MRKYDEAVVKKEYEVSNVYEMSIDWEGHNFLVIYGHHINGGFCSIPNWNVGCELSTADDRFFNTEKLSEVLKNKDMGKAIANAIADYDSVRVNNTPGYQTQEYQALINEKIQYIGKKNVFKNIVRAVGTETIYERAEGISDETIEETYSVIKQLENIKQPEIEDEEYDMER